MRLTRHDPQAVSHVRSTPRLPALWTGVVVVVALGAIYLLDSATGDAPVQHLYYLPIILAAARFGRRGGLVTSATAIVLYHLANPDLLTAHPIEADVVQIALFLLIGLVTARLVSDADRMRLLSRTDDLTGLHNLRSFEHLLGEMVRAARAGRDALSLLALDLDHLKELNDRHGHLTGAEAVRTVGQIIAAHIPADAIACRYGGDEFVVALPGCTEARASAIAHDLCVAVHAAAPELAGHRFPAATLSISIGAACRAFHEHAAVGSAAASETEEGEALFHAADTALYAAKANGRNRVCSAGAAASAIVRRAAQPDVG